MNKNTITPAQAFRAILLTTVIGTVAMSMTAKAEEVNSMRCYDIALLNKDLSSNKDKFLITAEKAETLDIKKEAYMNASLTNVDLLRNSRQLSNCLKGKDFEIDRSNMNTFNGKLKVISMTIPQLRDAMASGAITAGDLATGKAA
jgi:hypothetical protein